MKILPERRSFLVTFYALLFLTHGVSGCFVVCAVASWFSNTVAPAVSSAFHAATTWVSNAATTVAHDVVSGVETVAHDVASGVETAVHAAVSEATIVGGDIEEGVETAANWVKKTAGQVGDDIKEGVDAAGAWVVKTADDVGKDVVSGVGTAEHWVVDEADNVGHWAVNTADDVGNWIKNTASEAGQWIQKEAGVVGHWLLKAAQSATQFVIQTVEGVWQEIKGVALGISMLGKFVAMEVEGLFTPAQVDEPISDRTPPPLYDPSFPQYNNCTAGYVGSLAENQTELITKDLTILFNKMDNVSGEAYWNWMRCPGRYNFTSGMISRWYNMLTEDTQLFILGFNFNTTQSFPAEANGEMQQPTGAWKSCDGIFYDLSSAVSCEFNNLIAWVKTISWADVWKAGKFIMTFALDWVTLGVFSGVVNAVSDIQHHDWWGLVKDIATTVLFVFILL